MLKRFSDRAVEIIVLSYKMEGYNMNNKAISWKSDEHFTKCKLLLRRLNVDEFYVE